MNEHTAENDAPETVTITVDGDPLEIPAFLRDWLAEAWAEGYQTCCGDFDIAARGEARSPNPYCVIPPGSDAS